MYNNIGRKIKALAKWKFIIEAIFSVIMGFTLMEENGLYFLVCIIGPVVAWISSWALYALGEIAENVKPARTEEEASKTTPKQKAEEKATCVAEIKENKPSAKPTITKSVMPMSKPNSFESNGQWKKDIEALPNDEIYTRYIDEAEWCESYRYYCYLELKKRNVESVEIEDISKNELKIINQGSGYVCPSCGFPNRAFTACTKCGFAPFSSSSEETTATCDEYIEIPCPKCKETLSFLKGEAEGACPECGAEFNIL